MDLTAAWFWVGTVGMAAGTLLPLARLVVRDRHRRYYAVLAAVTGVATLAYLAMALGLGEVTSANGSLFVPRYLDWLVTTPLLVLYLGLLCEPSKRVYVALVVVDVAVIGSGVVAGLIAPPASYVAYLFGCVAYLGLLYLLLVVLPRQSSLDDDRVAATFTKLRNLTVVLWTLYPVVWILGPLGVGLLQTQTDAMVVAYLDLISKVGFVVMAVNGTDALDALDAQSASAGPSRAD
ncbi:bacteriorhodopsin [Halorussus halobius]|uniref:bacteriorhodopsin n=1 Tax=Halorussus halobius TaxID=1710537 RepID=UPI001092B690|nr:bacteriorhodopsin [Halorussus halobius]